MDDLTEVLFRKAYDAFSHFQYMSHRLDVNDPYYQILFERSKILNDVIRKAGLAEEYREFKNKEVKKELSEIIERIGKLNEQLHYEP